MISWIWKNGVARWILLLALAAGLLGGGYHVARHKVWPAYEAWREGKLNRMAAGFLQERRYDEALVTVRRNLAENPRNVESWRIGAAAAKAKGVSEAVAYHARYTQFRRTLPNQLELIRLALQHGVYRHALDTVQSIGAAARTNAEFHELAARTYRAVGRPAAAKYHLYSLVELRPEDAGARLDLAEIELAEDRAQTNRALRERVVTLAAQPALRTRALLLLLRDAVDAPRGPDALGFAEQLQFTTGLTAEQRILVLEGFMLGAPQRGAQYLAKLEDELAADPAEAQALLFYFQRVSRPTEARRWYETLPEPVRAAAPVQRAVSESLLALRDWSALERVTAGGRWEQDEYLRYAFITYAARAQERGADANNAWKLAVISAGDQVRGVVGLLERVHRWGWESEKHDLVGKLFALMPRNEKISQSLIAWERDQGKTANLNRLFARLVEVNPADREARNNFAYTSLLLDSNLSRALSLARDSHGRDPRNPYYTTTHALALFKQGKVAEARALMEGLGGAAIAVPERALLRARLRAASGDAAGAADLLAGLDSRRFLPEERRLLADTRTDIERILRREGTAAQVLALRTADEGEVRLTTEFKVLPASLRDESTHDLELADALVASGDARALGEHLRRAPWGGLEHIRLALTAWVSRSGGADSAARSYWRSAISTAGRDRNKLDQLVALAGTWEWRPERMEALERAFERDAADALSLAQLVDYHREGGRTADLVRVLSTYLGANPDDRDQQMRFAYYSMLSGLHVSRAYVAARQAFDARPDDPGSRLVYAFALWKQRRADEAWSLLERVPAGPVERFPTALVRAAVALDTQRRDDAASLLDSFDANGALPEEASLAAALRRRLVEERPTSRVSTL